MSSLGASVLALLLAIVLLGPRQWALLAIMAGVLYLTSGQGINVLGLNLWPMRFLELAGFLRVAMRGEFSFANINGMDRAVLMAYGYATIVFLVRTSLGYGTSAEISQVSSMAKIGTMVDITLCYFAFRGLITNIEDLTWFLRRFVFLLAPYVILVSIERLTGHNPFAIVGGIPEIWIDGNRIRCFGSFMHPSLLGTFGASFLMLYIGLALIKGNRFYALAGMVSCSAVVFLASSGGPLSFIAIGLVGWGLWIMRLKMFMVRCMIVGMLILLTFVMNSPLWYLPMKMSQLFGGGGWHRSYLMEQGFANIDQWWFAGMPMELTSDWFPYLVMGAADMTNLYLVFGVDGGLLAIVFFVLLLVRAFRQLGKALAVVRRDSPTLNASEFLLWGLGVVLAGHINNFIAITYFDQTNVVWLMQLAAISSLTQALAMRSTAVPGVLIYKELTMVKSRKNKIQNQMVEKKPGT